MVMGHGELLVMIIGVSGAMDCWPKEFLDSRSLKRIFCGWPHHCPFLSNIAEGIFG